MRSLSGKERLLHVFRQQLTDLIYPDVPLDNIEALCQATEEYSIYYS